MSADEGVHLKRGGRTRKGPGTWAQRCLFWCDVELIDVDDARHAYVGAYDVEAVHEYGCSTCSILDGLPRL